MAHTLSIGNCFDYCGWSVKVVGFYTRRGILFVHLVSDCGVDFRPTFDRAVAACFGTAPRDGWTF